MNYSMKSAAPQPSMQASMLCGSDGMTARVTRSSPLVEAGDGQAYLDNIKVYADNRPEGHGPVGTCIRENRACIFNDFQNSVLAAPRPQAAAAYGLPDSL